ncbi:MULTISPECIES: chlororespiratory reduction protein 7 [Aerosakkonema]|uniref:Chlororespiratory reduction protein 7 n=1 Tax=Aerosakkonema funiforme FACHB-1375 TaxID=2949571 RepID=A0A926VPY9_9CYAN|nr:chlororespiratory reduction protein 7 [Aerosakkonema funiforme]MBD2186479.1 chlororespiratory reduction protein 7 [Aerosakkonema funiforme FACHB-1375]
MPDPMMFQQDAFVVLEPNQPEQFLTPSELLEKLKQILAQRQDNLPRDLQKFTSLESQAQYLLDTSCDLDVGPGQYLQWYAVRLEK